jgi:hypothetical protein
MTWLKESDDFAVDCRALSDAAYRTHDEALLWVMRHLTGGRIPKRQLRWLAATKNPQKAAAELLAGGFWKDHGEEYEVIHGMEDQIEPEVLAKRKADAAERQRRKRRKDAGLLDEGDVT